MKALNAQPLKALKSVEKDAINYYFKMQKDNCLLLLFQIP